MSTAKKTAKAKKTVTKKVAPKAKAKTYTFKPSTDPTKSDLLRGDEILSLRKQGATVPEIVEAYKKAGLKIAAPTVYNAQRIFEAPAEFGEAIAKGRVKPTDVLPLLKGRKSASERLKDLRDLIAARKQKVAFLKESGFGNSATKLTSTRKVGLIREKLAKIVKGKTLTDNRAKAVLEFLGALDTANDAQSIDALVASYAKKAKA